MRRASRLGALLALAAIGWSSIASGQERRAKLVDRVVARWRTAEPGSESHPHPIFARELAFEARIEAMALGEAPGARLVDRHLRAALTRHVTEALLEQLPLEPAPTPTEVGEMAVRARRVLLTRVGGEERLRDALALEGLSQDELDAMLRRTARASLYLDRMVAPQLEPTEGELRELHASGRTPYSDRPFANAVEDLRRWVVARRISEALDAFFQRARSRVVITWSAERATR